MLWGLAYVLKSRGGSLSAEVPDDDVGSRNVLPQASAAAVLVRFLLGGERSCYRASRMQFHMGRLAARRIPLNTHCNLFDVEK